MKFLLTSGGISNTSIHTALEALLGKPIAESSALFIPTAAYAIPSGAAVAARLIRGEGGASPFCDLGWKSLVGGGEVFYLCYWMWQSGLVDLLPTLRHEMVYVGGSAGSLVVTSDFGDTYDGINPPTGSDKALGLVDFALCCHLDKPSLPDSSLANLEKWAAGVRVPAYLIDDQTAIQVVDGAVDVISEGHWKLVTQE